MIEEESAYLRFIKEDMHAQRMIQIPGRPGWFVNESIWQKLMGKLPSASEATILRSAASTPSADRSFLAA